MPEGVEVVVVDGFATIDFVDKSKTGPGLAALLNVGTPPAAIEKLTRPRVLYVVPEGNARQAGLLDEASQVDALQAPDTSSARDVSGVVPPEFPSTRDLYAQVMRSSEYGSGGGVEDPADGTFTELVSEDSGGPYEILPQPVKAWPDGEPDDDWKRGELDAYATAHGLATRDLPNKDAVLAAIRAAT